MRATIVEPLSFDHVPEFMVQTSKMLFKRQVDGHASDHDRRYEILEAALRLIGEGGPDAVTFRRVAAGAKAPLSSLTYYFASRQELIREAFRLYLSEASAFVLGVEHEKRPRTPSGVVDLLLEIVRKEFSHDPAMVRVEYELILYAARDSSLAREFNDYERKLEAGLARSLEILGARRPIDAARTLIDLIRGFEIERLTYEEAEIGQLERRLKLVVEALINERQAYPSQIRHQRRVRRANRKRRSMR
jgi:DNA-binding transcriptional regulator YbjK